MRRTKRQVNQEKEKRLKEGSKIENKLVIIIFTIKED
jgi:hypothetical protein